MRASKIALYVSGVDRALCRPCLYPWISVGVLGTDGGHSAWYHFILSSRPGFSSSFFFCLFLFVLFPGSPFLSVLPLPSFLPPSPSFFVALLFIYSFGPSAALCPSARRLVGCSLGWTLNVGSFEYLCSGYTDLPRLPAESTWRL